MQIVERKLTELKPYKNNPKRHSEEQIDELANSIELTKGLTQNIVIDKNNVIVAGHGRYLAAKKLKMKTVPCTLLEDMTEDEIRAYRLIDNRISGNDYDLEIEFAEMQEIELDLGDYGIEVFDMDDIEEVNAYNPETDDSEYFSATFTFPTEKKKQILSYLRKHKQEITEEIIEKAGE